MTKYKYEFKLDPWAHQREVLTRSWNKIYYAYFMDMGTGKSKTLIDTVAMNWEMDILDGLLLVAPKGVYLNWIERELPKHMPERIPTRIVPWVPWSSANKKQKKAIEELITPPKRGARTLDIFVMNIDAFKAKKFEKSPGYLAAKQFLSTRRCMHAIDESTDIKNPKANCTKATINLRPLSVMRRIMSGYPITRDPRDLFSQLLFLNWEILGHRSFFSYMAEYAVSVERVIGRASVDDLADEIRSRMEQIENPRPRKERKFQMVVGFKNTDQLYERIAPHSYRILSEECQDLPKKMYDYIDVELTKEQKIAYDQMAKNMVIEAEGEKFSSASIALTKILRLRQITSGHVKWDEGESEQLPSNRIPAIMERLKEFSGKAVIWACFKPDLVGMEEALAKEYGKESVVNYHGGTKDKDKMPNLARFHSDPTCRWFVGNPASGGRGIETVAARLTIYLSNSDNLDHRIQSEKRMHRAGQTADNVLFLDVRATNNGKNTADHKVVKCMRDKKRMADEVMRDPITEWI